MSRFGVILILFGGALVLRIFWSYNPSLISCCAFWATMGLSNIVLRQWWAIPGFLCNATATIANGGYMPSNHDIPRTGIYVALTQESSLPYLCDYFDGVSIGDFLVLVGFGVLIATTFWKAKKDRALAH